MPSRNLPESAYATVCRGYSLVELLVTLALIGGVLTWTLSFWSSTSARLRTSTAARQTKLFIHQARMQAIFRNLNHFLVLDPDAHTLEIFADDGSTPGDLDAADERVATTGLDNTVALALPAEPSPLGAPVGSGNLSTSWSLPGPDSGGEWGTTRRGFMLTPRGEMLSAEATPQEISSGTIVFSTPRNNTSVVTISGTIGNVRAHEYFDGRWLEL